MKTQTWAGTHIMCIIWVNPSMKNTNQHYMVEQLWRQILFTISSCYACRMKPEHQMEMQT